MFVKVFYSVFLGPQFPRAIDVKEVPRGMLITMGVVAVAIIIIGVFPDLVLKTLVEPATQALIGYKTYIAQVVFGGI